MKSVTRCSRRRSRRLDLGIQRLGRAPLVPRAPGIGLQGLLERLVERRELVGCSPRRYFGGPSTSPCNHFEIVLRDSPVMRAISRSDFFLRLCNRRILPIMSMVITPRPLLHKNAAG
jgi:hypothetical protein